MNPDPTLTALRFLPFGRALVRLLPLAVLLASLGATAWLADNASREAERELQTTFDYRVREAALRIRQRMSAYEQVLRGVQGLFAASFDVNRKEFAEYVARLRLRDTYPGIVGVGFHPWVTARDKLHHVEAAHRDGLAGYAIVPEGDRPGYAPLRFLVGQRDSAWETYGQDALADAEPRAAMESARDSGNATVSGRIGKPGETARVTLYLPVYRNGVPTGSVGERRAALVGWISSAFLMDDLMIGILGEHASSLDIEIYDGLEMDDRSLLYDADGIRFADHALSRFRTIERLPIGGHYWLMAVSSQPAFDTRIKQDKAQVIAVSGSLGGVLLTLLTWLLIRGREKALRAAAKLNNELAERSRIQERLTQSEERWRFALEGAGDGVWDWHPESGEAIFSPRWTAMLGYAPGQFGNDIGAWRERVHPDDKPRMDAAFDDFLSGRNHELKFEQRMRCRDDQWKWTLVRGMVAARDDAGKPQRLIGTLTDVSETHLLTEKLQQSHDLLEKLSAQVPGALCQFRLYPDGRTRIPFASRAFAEVFELEPRQVRDNATPMFERTHPDDYATLIGAIHDSAFHLRPLRHEYRVVLPNQGEGWRLVEARPERLGDDSTLWHGFVTDISERHRREEALRLAATVFDIVDEALLVTDPENHIIAVNPAFTVITGYTAAEVLDHNPRILSAGTQPAAEFRDMWQSLHDKGSWQGEIWNRKKDGEVYVVWLSIKLVRDAHGKVTHHVAVFSDISERKAREQNILHQAHHDPLTDLPNRALFGERLSQALLRARREGQRMALMFLDLDRFKPVNDTLGHAVGDLLLQEVAQRLVATVRESDIVARVGGDEFIVLLPTLDLADDALPVAGKVIGALEAPFTIGEHHLEISASIGIALYPEQGDNEETLTHHADIAMYHAKKAGRGQAVVYNHTMSGPAGQ